MRVCSVNEGTLRKPRGPCYAFAIFLQLKEVHLFPVKSHRVTANPEYFKSIRRKKKKNPQKKNAVSASVFKAAVKKKEVCPLSGRHRLAANLNVIVCV